MAKSRIVYDDGKSTHLPKNFYDAEILTDFTHVCKIVGANKCHQISVHSNLANDFLDWLEIKLETDLQYSPPYISFHSNENVKARQDAGRRIGGMWETIKARRTANKPVCMRQTVPVYSRTFSILERAKYNKLSIDPVMGTAILYLTKRATKEQRTAMGKLTAMVMVTELAPFVYSGQFIFDLQNVKINLKSKRRNMNKMFVTELT